MTDATGSSDSAGLPGPVSTAQQALPTPEGEVARTGMFGQHGPGDTSGFGGLIVRSGVLVSTPAPWGGWFDDAYGQLERAYPAFAEGVEAVVVEFGELTIHLRREALLATLAVLRDELRFELLSGVSGVDYPQDQSGRRLHVVYQLLSMTHQRRLRVEVSLASEDAVLPSAVAIYPTADWHERETFDFFGVVFQGHPGLTRIFMPDDWEGHPQRKDYPLGGIPVDYHGATIPPPDQRRSYA
jgi:NADH-quinone oxidoreductase subunit C